MAVFTIGANPFQITKMTDYIRTTWKFAGTYTETKRLLEDGKAGRFKYVLVCDLDALDAIVQKQLRSIGVEVISFKDQRTLSDALQREREKKIKADKERNVRLEFEKELAVIKL
jgi:hypothetical protein